MQAIVTIFKAELIGKETVESQLHAISSEVKQVGDAFIYSPNPGKLFEFLNIVRAHQIAYGTHVNSAIEDASNRSDV